MRSVDSHDRCCISKPAATGPINVPTPVPASAMPDAWLRWMTNQRCTVATRGTYTRPTPSPTSEQNRAINSDNEPDA